MAVNAGPRNYGSAGRSIGSFKQNFFDADAILRAMDKTTHKALSKFGAYVRQRARSSIRKAPKADPKTGRVLRGRKKKGQAVIDAVAPPGRPPYGHGRGLLKKFIYFAYDRQKKTVVIGPAKFPNPRGGGPEFLEYGGRATLRGRRGKPRAEHFRGNPFMGPALGAEMPNLMKFFQEAGF